MREDFIIVELKDNLVYEFENLTFSYFKIYACNNSKYLQKNILNGYFIKTNFLCQLIFFID